MNNTAITFFDNLDDLIELGFLPSDDDDLLPSWTNRYEAVARSASGLLVCFTEDTDDETWYLAVLTEWGCICADRLSFGMTKMGWKLLLGTATAAVQL